MKALSLLAAALLLTSVAAHSQTIVPGLSGINRVPLLGNSDTIISASFLRPAAGGGLALNFAGNVVTFKGSPNWAANQFVPGGAVADTFFLFIASGPREGSYYTITANTTNTLTVDLQGETLAGLAADTTLSIIPYWTLSTLFPSARGIHPSPSAEDRQTEVLFPDYNAPGINAAPNRVFYYFDSHWLEVGQGAASRDNVVIYPDSYIIVRHNIAANTEFVSSGQVLLGAFVTPVGVNPAGARDNHLALIRPTTNNLMSSGLIQFGGFVTSPGPDDRADELHVFDNAAVQKNKQPSAVFYHWNGAWRKVGSGTQNVNATPVFTPGSGFIIRKKASATSPLWINTPNY